MNDSEEKIASGDKKNKVHEKGAHSSQCKKTHGGKKEQTSMKGIPKRLEYNVVSSSSSSAK